MIHKFDHNRKSLPAFGYLQDKQVDLAALIEHCQKENLIDHRAYNDIKVGAGAPIENFVRLNAFNKMSFFVEDNAAYLQGESYKQLYLTELKPELRSHQIDENKNWSPGGRFRRLDPNDPSYNPLVDELNYTHRNHLVKGIFKDILDLFSDQVTRVRLAYLAPNFSIKPHVDHDPSYIVRYHIPILTNPLCTMNVERDRQPQACHFAADGRIYFLNAGLKHWASNQSNQWRLHLIVDVHGQKELKNLVPVTG